MKIIGVLNIIEPNRLFRKWTRIFIKKMYSFCYYFRITHVILSNIHAY